MDLDAELDELFALPADAFTNARNDLAKRLTAGGRREDAASVKALRKPTVSAALVNRLVRSQSETFAELVAIGRKLQGEPTADEVREAEARRRRLVAELTKAAEKEARSGGHAAAAQPTIARVSQTLYAIGAGAGAEEALRGRLTRDLDVSAGDQMFSMSPEVAVSSPDETERERAARARVEELERLADEAEAEAGAAVAEAERAARSASTAAARAEVARRSAAKARERADRARSAL